MKGRKRSYSGEEKETARQLYAENQNKLYVSRKLNIPEATVRLWVKEWEKDPKWQELVDKKTADFAARADKLIDTGMKIMKRRLDRVYEFEDELDTLIGILIQKGDISQSEIKSVLSKLSAVTIPNIREITTAIGTMYDKAALAKGNTTDNVSVKILLPEGGDEYAG